MDSIDYMDLQSYHTMPGTTVRHIEGLFYIRRHILASEHM